jgi:hypothetical protein
MERSWALICCTPRIAPDTIDCQHPRQSTWHKDSKHEKAALDPSAQLLPRNFSPTTQLLPRNSCPTTSCGAATTYTTEQHRTASDQHKLTLTDCLSRYASAAGSSSPSLSITTLLGLSRSSPGPWAVCMPERAASMFWRASLQSRHSLWGQCRKITDQHAFADIHVHFVCSDRV